jgi:hypothetical protein
MSNRPKVAIVLDYTLRLPNFKECYSIAREQILTNNKADTLEQKDIIIENNYWQQQAQQEEVLKFYAQITVPELDEQFDMSLKKYFYNEEHLNKFLEEWSYNLFGQGSVTNKADINMINIAQTKLCDIVLIDVTTHTRKISNTFAFLARTGIFIKEVRFLTHFELENIKEEFFDIWNPYESKNIILPNNKFGQPSEKLLEWFEEVEKKIKNK